MSRARTRFRARSRVEISPFGGTEHIGQGHGYGSCDDRCRNWQNPPVHPLHLSYSYAIVSVLLREAEVCSFPMRLRSEGDDRLLA